MPYDPLRDCVAFNAMQDHYADLDQHDTHHAVFDWDKENGQFHFNLDRNAMFSQAYSGRQPLVSNAGPNASSSSSLMNAVSYPSAWPYNSYDTPFSYRHSTVTSSFSQSNNSHFISRSPIQFAERDPAVNNTHPGILETRSANLETRSETRSDNLETRPSSDDFTGDWSFPDDSTGTSQITFSLPSARLPSPDPLPPPSPHLPPVEPSESPPLSPRLPPVEHHPGLSEDSQPPHSLLPLALEAEPANDSAEPDKLTFAQRNPHRPIIPPRSKPIRHQKPSRAERRIRAEANKSRQEALAHDIELLRQNLNEGLKKIAEDHGEGLARVRTLFFYGKGAKSTRSVSLGNALISHKAQELNSGNEHF